VLSAVVSCYTKCNVIEKDNKIFSSHSYFPEVQEFFETRSSVAATFDPRVINYSALHDAKCSNISSSHNSCVQQ